jgi:hypothetical protein
MTLKTAMNNVLVDEVAGRIDKALRDELLNALTVAYTAGFRDARKAMNSGERAETTDRTRMDWLEHNAVHFVRHKEKGNGVIRLRKGLEEPIDLRRAIDEAMVGDTDVYVGSDRGA